MAPQHIALGLGGLVVLAIVGNALDIEDVLTMGLLCSLGLGCYAVIQRLRLKTSLAQGNGDPSALDHRLDALEQRLTDVQDVMIALSEKMDRLESAKTGV